jgi:hypothetical protein
MYIYIQMCMYIYTYTYNKYRYVHIVNDEIDADLDTAVEQIVLGATSYNGQ